MDLLVQKRNKFGKAVKSLRRDGLIPAELYGHGIANEHLSVSVKEFAGALKSAGENTVISVVIDGQKRPALIYDFKKHPLTGEFLSADFYQVRMDEKIQTEVPLVFSGEAPAIKEFGAIVVKAMQEIEVEALPADLPKEIEISLKSLDAFNKSIYVRDLKPISGVKFLVDPDTVVVTVKEPAKEEEKAAPTAPPAGGAAAPVAGTGPETKTTSSEKTVIK